MFPRRLSPAVLAVGLAVAVAAVWSPALSGGFVWDDQFDIVRSDRLHQIDAVVEVFRHGAMWTASQPEAKVATYRPLATASLAIDYQLYGLSPLGFHATSIILHVLATLAVFLAIGRFVSEPRSAAALALLFALHPANVEAVAWINGRSEIFALGFGALALWAATHQRWVVVALALAAAMLGKESGAIFVPLAVAAAWIEPAGKHVRLRWAAPIAAAAGLVLYGTLRTMALGNSALPGSSLGKAVAALPAVWIRAAQEALLPLERSLITISTWLSGLGTVELVAYAACAVAFLGLFLLLIVRRRYVAALGLAWWLGSLVPLMTIAILALPWPGLARWLYIGLPGLLLFVWSAGLDRLGRRARIVVFAAVAVVWLVLTERAIPVWHDDTTLFATMIEESPDEPWAWRSLGTDQLMQGHYAEAAELFQAAADRDRTHAVHGDYQLIAYAWTFLGRCDEAVRLFGEHPRNEIVLPDRFANVAADCYSRAGNLARARELWSSCASVNPICASSLEQSRR